MNVTAQQPDNTPRLMRQLADFAERCRMAGAHGDSEIRGDGITWESPFGRQAAEWFVTEGHFE